MADFSTPTSKEGQICRMPTSRW
ncbi:unnamed protein product [Spirodela intermedia]|uniref:Uncharacterized protein n=1 Tax=Spirodela intermedia TaxID=51605 RepID=A0A7I8JK00_SPIIN|nr:unnamed protein product [Spirodela intermedia]CAA6669923.1 unnamed protein product [Spirodela intermedia]